MQYIYLDTNRTKKLGNFNIAADIQEWSKIQIYVDIYVVDDILKTRTKGKIRRSDSVLWQKPLCQQKIRKAMDNTKIPPKPSITQRFRTDLGRSVGVTTVIQLVWLNRFTGKTSDKIYPISSNGHPSTTANIAIHCLERGGDTKPSGTSYNLDKVWSAQVHKMVRKNSCIFRIWSIEGKRGHFQFHIFSRRFVYRRH